MDLLRRQDLVTLAQANEGIAGDLIKWTLGALLVVNGGALLALIGSSDLRGEAFNGAVYFYSGGLLAAVIGGSCSSFAFGLLGNELRERAWNAEPLPERYEIEGSSTLRKWLGAAVLLWIASLGLFILGCVSTARIPYFAAAERSLQESREATRKLELETEVLTKVLQNPHSTREEVQAARDRVRGAQVESALRMERMSRTIDPANFSESANANSAGPAR